MRGCAAGIGSRLRVLVAAAAILVLARTAHAQLAPTGSHYAARASDTGFGFGPTATGGFAAEVPLDLPAARGGLPVPVRVVSGARGFAAAGLGWDVPLSYVLVDRSLAHRRPAYALGQTVAPREQVTLALPGRRIELVPRGDGWIGRIEPDVTMSRAARHGYLLTHIRECLDQPTTKRRMNNSSGQWKEIQNLLQVCVSWGSI